MVKMAPRPRTMLYCASIDRRAAAMSALATAVHRIPARELLAPAELAGLRERREWKSIALIVHAWAVILGSVALVALCRNPLTYIIALALARSRPLALGMLVHACAPW